MTKLREAAQQALDVLFRASSYYDTYAEIDALRAALEQPDHTEQPLEMVAPAAWIFTWYEIANDRYVRRIIDCEERPNIPGYDLIPLYTAPPQREWQGLTDEEIDKVTDSQWSRNNHKPIYAAHRAYARAIEAKLKEKNT